MPTTTFHDYIMHYNDEDEFRTLLEEIWKKRTYYVDLPTNTPFIIDAGAHIGLTTLYFHSLYPHAEFVCIEPNPSNIPLLRANLADNRVEHVTILQKALAKTEGKAQLFSNPKWTVFSSLQKAGWTGEEQGEYVEVETTTLSSLHEKHVDILKMDIEGEETTVIREAQNKLRLVDHLLIEFHQTSSHKEDLILKILHQNYSEVSVTKDERKERTRTNKLLFIEASRR